MIKFIVYFIIIISSTFYTYRCIKMYRSSKNLFEKILYILLLLILFTPITIYLLDAYDMPTKLGLTDGLDVSKWFDFIGSYAIGIVSAIISGCILYLITLKQINVQVESNKDDKRIQNAPVFDYDLTNEVTPTKSYQHNVSTKEKGNIYIAFFKIENIGLNHGKNTSVLVQIDDVVGEKCFLNNQQSFVKKEECAWIEFTFSLNKNKHIHRKVIIDVYYEDLLNNQYVQRLNALFNIDKDNLRLNITNFKVENAVLIKKGQ